MLAVPLSTEMHLFKYLIRLELGSLCALAILYNVNNRAGI